MTKGEVMKKYGIKIFSVNVNPNDEADEDFIETVKLLVEKFDEIYEDEDE